MAWSTEEDRIPTSIPRIEVILIDSTEYDNDKEGPLGQEANFSLRVLDQDGQLLSKKGGDLVPHLTQQQIDALMNFITSLRIQAESELLP